MCTAISLKSDDNHYFFGRNMDIEYDFGQKVTFVPRGFQIKNRVTNEDYKTKYAILGMASVVDNYPLFADGFNEQGLACAGLNFPGYASYDDDILENSINIAPYDFILWVLSNFSTVDEVLSKIQKIRLINKEFMKGLALPPLHWIIYDKTGKSIVIEKTKDKLSVFENKLGVLSNSPTFDWHLTNLNQYAGLSSKNPEDTSWRDENLSPNGQGAGLFGIPGDCYPASRFVRASYFCSHANRLLTKEKTLASFFRILGNLAFVDGSVITKDGHTDLTIYSSAMDLNDCIYYYNTYDNLQITAISMNNEDLNGKTLKTFDYITKPNILNQN